MFKLKSNCPNEMSLGIKLTETLMLRRIHPETMLKYYLEGKYKDMKIPDNKVKISSAFVGFNKKIGQDQTSNIYKFTDKTNTGQLIYTTNHQNYQYTKDKNLGKSSIHPGTKCVWCRRDITENPVGIVVKMEISPTGATFYMEDDYDTFGCALASLKRLNSCHHMYKDPKYMDADQLLHCLYYRMYPDKIGTRIKEAPDWRLLDINGGPLTGEEFDFEQVKYIEIPNVILLPLKRQYIRLNITKPT
jgi:hypothetical protein